MKHAAIAVTFLIVALCTSCGRKGEAPSTEAGKSPAPTAASAKDLYFPPEERPTRTTEADLATLLEEYITPHLKVLALREKDKEALPPNTVAIRFNYPMVEKEKIGVPLKQGAWSFIPYRAGTYIWKDESQLTFQPNRPWDNETEVTGVLPTGLASLNGYKLLEPYQEAVEFKGGIEIAGKLISTDDITPGEPKIIGIDPPVGGTIGNVPGVVLIFDQPVLVDYVRGKVEMAVKEKGSQDFRVLPHVLLHAKETMIKGSRVADNFTVLIKPATALPYQSEVKLTFAAGLKEADEYEAKFETPRPLLLESVSCQQWTACQIAEESTAAGQRLLISDATGYLKLKFNDSIETAMGKEVLISPTPKQQKAEVVDKILYLSWDWQPSTNYTIRFTDRFRNQYGFSLGKGLSIALRTGHLLPAIEAPIGLKAVDRGKETALKVRWRNLSSVHIKQYPVTGDDLASILQYYWESPGEGFFSSPMEEKPVEIDFAGNPEANAWQEGKVSIRQLMEKQSANIFFLQYETYPFVPQTPESAKRLSALVQVTDVGLMAKRLPGGLFVSASSMATGAPQAGIAVTVLTLDGNVIAEGETDEEGGLFIEVDDATDLLKAPLLLAERGAFAAGESEEDESGGEGLLEELTKTDSPKGDDASESAYLWIGDKKISADFFELPRASTSTVEAAIKAKGERSGFIFTDKGVYRGGQTMHIKGYIARPADGGDKQIELLLRPASGQDALMKETIPLGTRPSFQFDWKVDADASPGRYRLEASTAGTVASADLLIADSTNATFKVDVVNSKRDLLSGEPWPVEIRPEYFFGLPVAHGALEYTVYFSPIAFAPPGFEGYDFSDRYAAVDIDSWNELVSNQKISLSGSGLNRLSLPTKEEWWDEHVSSPIRLYLSATVSDISGDTMSTDAEATAYPSDLYVGLSDRYEYAKDRPLVFEWVALSAIDRRVLSGIEATAELYRLEENWYQEEGAEEDSYYAESETLKDLVASCTARSGAGREGCSLGTQPPGRYALRIASKGGNGVMVAAAREIVVAGGGLMPIAESKKHLVKPTMDRERYRPGETAFVLFENHYPKGYATITVENGTILDRKTVAVGEGMVKVPVKIREEYAPNAFVGVHLSIGRRGQMEDGAGGDVAGPTYLVGYAPLAVDQVMQRLGIGIATDKGQYQPGEKVRVELSATDGAGKPVGGGEVTLYAVDESTLELTKYKTPEPLPAMYPERPLAVEIADSRTKVYSTDYLLSVMEKGQVGGDGGMAFDDFAKKKVRTEFPDTLFWKPDLETGADGKVRAEFALSDATGGVRIMAVAHKDGKLFGSAELPLRVAMPLSADPLLPAFLIRGDRFDARVRIHNTTREAQAVTVGLTTPRGETKEVRVEPSGTAIATFALQAPAEGNEMPVEIAVRSKNFTDTIKRTVPVHDDFVIRTRAIGGTFDKEQVVHLKKPEGWEGANAVHLTFSSAPIPDLTRALYGILTYPYASLSAVVSALQATATIRDRFEDFLPKGYTSDDVLDKHIDARIKMLSVYQLPSGGFSSWPAGTREDALETAHALFVLSQIDFDHDDTVFDALRGRVREMAKRGVDGGSSEYDQRVAAQTLSALAFAGEADGALGTQLAALRQKLSPFSLGMTIIGLAKMGRPQDVAGILPLLVEKLRTSVNAGDRAVGLLALMAADPKNASVAPLVAGLFSEKNAMSTPPLTAASLMAYAAYAERAKRASVPKVELILDDLPLGKDALHKENAFLFSVDLPFEADGLLRMKSTNGKTVYFSASATARDIFSVAPDSRMAEGIDLFATIEDKDGKGADWDHLILGDLYHLRLYAKANRQIGAFFLDVALPAGLAPLSLLAPPGPATPDTSGGSGTVGEDEEGGDRRYLLIEKTQGKLTHTEYHSDRVRFFADDLPEGFYCFDFYARAVNDGGFLMPPPEAGSMIDPGIWARLPARRVEVEGL